METFSTKQVAHAVGISRITLQRWLVSGKVAEPDRIEVAGIQARVWTQSDVDRIRLYKQARYRKGRGKKKKNH